jgi:putative phage-type endonuclease
MAISIQTFPTAKEWLNARDSFVGGSDAASIIGLSPWRNNVELWEEKTGRRKKADLSDNPLVKYGSEAEPLLRKLFILDAPEMEVHYEPWNMWRNDALPWAHASLDGWLKDQDGRFGILEIKTATIQSSAHAAQWRDKIPDMYYCQLLHYFAVTGADFAVVVAQLKYPAADQPYKKTLYIHIERAEVEEDIATLIDAERIFAECVQKDKAPALLLPNI